MFDLIMEMALSAFALWSVWLVQKQHRRIVELERENWRLRSPPETFNCRSFVGPFLENEGLHDKNLRP